MAVLDLQPTRRGGDGPHRQTARTEPPRRGPGPDREPGRGHLRPGGGGVARRACCTSRLASRRSWARSGASAAGEALISHGRDRKRCCASSTASAPQGREADSPSSSSPLASGTCCTPWPRAMGDKEIARRLGCGLGTVRGHVLEDAPEARRPIQAAGPRLRRPTRPRRDRRPGRRALVSVPEATHPKSTSGGSEFRARSRNP